MFARPVVCVRGFGAMAVRGRVALGTAVGAAALAVVLGAEADGPARPRRPQFVLMSIDTTPSARRPLEGSPFYELYRAINNRRDPARPANTYTLFASTGGLQLEPGSAGLDDDARRFLGVEPRNQQVVHYARDVAEIQAKVANLRGLAALGVEIGAHGVRHAHGRTWDDARWRLELRDHERVLDLVGLAHPFGFRAPFLERNAHLYRVLDELGMRYDASETGRASRWPVRYPGTRVWVFSIPSVDVPGASNALFYDLNLQTVLRRAAERAGVSGERAVQAWMDAQYVEAGVRTFMQHYRGNRAPFLISSHGELFRRPIIQLMARICSLPDVRCGSFSEAVAYLDRDGL